MAELAVTATLMLFLSACGPDPEQTAESTSINQPAEELGAPKLTPEQALNQYADALVAGNSSDFTSHDPARMTSSARPLAYVMTFYTQGSNYVTKKNIAEDDQAGYEANLKITNRWQAIYCTGALKQLMRNHGIFSAGGNIVDSRGQKHSMAICVV